MEKRSRELDLIASHSAAMIAALHTLVRCLQQNGALKHGQYPEMLRQYLEVAREDSNPEALAILHNLRRSLLD